VYHRLEVHLNLYQPAGYHDKFGFGV